LRGRVFPSITALTALVCFLLIHDFWRGQGQLYVSCRLFLLILYLIWFVLCSLLPQGYEVLERPVWAPWPGWAYSDNPHTAARNYQVLPFGAALSRALCMIITVHLLTHIP